MSLSLRSRDSWLPGVVRKRPDFDGSIKDWFEAGDWVPESGMTKKKLLISVHTTGRFVDACVNDAILLAIAAFESAASKEQAPADSKSCAWQFIKYYYAAYFSANALMRLCGYACLNFTAKDCNAINMQALLYGVGGMTEKDKFVPGLYQMHFSQVSTPTIKLRMSTGKGGVHIQFWSGFLEFLNALKVDISQSTAPKFDRQAALAELAVLVNELQRSGTLQGAWLSEMRNSVNYRFEHGVWFPYADSDTDLSTIRSAFKQIVQGAASINTTPASLSETVRAARSCAFLVAWLHNSIATIGSVSKGPKKTLIDSGPLAFASQF